MNRSPPRPASPGSRIAGLGHYRPDRVVTNDDLSQIMDTNDEWIRSRVGIAERRFAGADESVASMGARAGAKALAEAGLHAGPRSTRSSSPPAAWSPRSRTPPTQIAGALGIHAPGLVRHQRRVRRLLLRHRRRRPGGPDRRVAQRAGGRLGEAHRLDQARRPGDRDHLRRRRRRRRGHRRRRTRHRPGDLGQRREPHSRPSGSRAATATSSRRARPSSAGPPPRSPRWRSGRPRPPASQLADIDVLVTHQANLRIIDAIAKKIDRRRRAGRTSRSAGTSSPPATPRRRPFRSRWTGCGRPARSPPATWCSSVAFGAGLTYASQVFSCPVTGHRRIAATGNSPR